MSGQELQLGAYRRQNIQNRIKEDPDALGSRVLGKEPTDHERKLLDPEQRVVAEKRKHGLLFLRETLIFLLFLLTFVLVSIFSIPPWGYDAVAVTRELVLNRTVFYHDARGERHSINFYGVRSPADLSNWLRHALLPLMFSEYDASGREYTEYERLFVLQNNRIMGPVRLRQLRVKPGSCDLVDHLAGDLGIKSCYAPFGVMNTDKSTFGATYRFNGKTGYTMQEIDSLIAQGYGMNVTEVPNSRYPYRDSSDLCAENPDPGRDVGATVDETGRPVMGGNSGLSWWCRVGAGTVGVFGTVYPNGGFVEDFPPGSWYQAWDQWRSEKLAVSQEWLLQKGPKAPPPPKGDISVTKTQTYRVPTTTMPLRSSTPCLVNESCTQVPVFYRNATATLFFPWPTKTVVPVPTTTPIDTDLALPPFPSKLEHSLLKLDELDRFLWFSPATAMVSVEFSLYNANVRTAVSSRLVFEFLASGGVLPDASIKTFDLYQVETTHERGVLVGELLITIWVAYYLFVELRKIKGYITMPWRHCQVCCMNKIRREGLSPIIVCPNCQRPFHPFLQPCCPDCFQDVHSNHQCWRGYFQSVWNVIDFINVVIFIVVFGYRYRLRRDLGQIQIRTETQFIPFYPIAWQQSFVKYINSFNVILCFMKLVKYLGKVQALSKLMGTVRHAFIPMVNVILVVSLLLLGFALAFMLTFGADARSYRDLEFALVSLWRMWTGKGEFQWEELYASNEVLANILFLVFNIGMFWVLTSIIIAVVCEAHAAAAEEAKLARADYLNSALNLLLRNLKTTLARFFDHDPNLDKAKVLLLNLQQVPNLTRDQRDDVRAFMRALDETPDEELTHEILKVFHHDVQRVMRMEDYKLLTATVLRYKRESRKRAAPTQGIWGQQTEEPEQLHIPSAPPSAAVIQGRAAARAVQEARNRSEDEPPPETNIAVRIHAMLGRLDVLEDGLERVYDLLVQRGSIIDPGAAERALRKKRRSTLRDAAREGTNPDAAHGPWFRTSGAAGPGAKTSAPLPPVPASPWQVGGIGERAFSEGDDASYTGSPAAPARGGEDEWYAGEMVPTDKGKQAFQP
eukprot:TRINITY_DN69926_c0_g1_i1.p1 TRINITY_DN69926_c0_g1~~TRINITY_DN69926_c0_g1_i1.p1  ORF type:complete len:1077 (+),score=356.66 TRINITY_DN69926_c0_g1_i1:97-3327(+)